MRVFIPATLKDLTKGHLSANTVVVPEVTESGADAVEIAEFIATEDASILSLELIRESSEAPYQRVVIALEVKNLQETQQSISWQQVKAIFVDNPLAETAVKAACEAQTQEEADTAVEEVLEHDLEWYAPEEITMLRSLAVNTQR